MTDTPRQHLLDTLADFLGLWKDGGATVPTGFAATQLTSNVHGKAIGAKAIATVLTPDAHGVDLSLASTNHYVASGAAGLHVSAYVHGRRAASTRTGVRVSLFGAAVIVTAVVRDDEMVVTSVDLTIDWVDGDLDPPEAWTPPRGSRFWKPGDKPPTLVSELHAPWSRSPDATTIGNADDHITDVFMRYIWSIDRADFGGMVKCLAPDMVGDFPPIGRLAGISDVIGQLKAFRQAWPWMQHFCVPLAVDKSADDTHAEVVIGRIIPYRLEAPSGAPAYGAHYRLSLDCTGGVWAITRFAYIEGWVEWVNGAPRALR